MTQSAFNFLDKTEEMRLATQLSNRRRSKTVFGTVQHQVMHSGTENATIHHAVTAARPHPVHERAQIGEYYMVAYISAPIQWLRYVDKEFCYTWDISFIGPSGTILALPPALSYIDDLTQERFYIGFDWLFLNRDDMGETGMPKQPNHADICSKMLKCIAALRQVAESLELK